MVWLPAVGELSQVDGGGGGGGVHMLDEVWCQVETEGVELAGIGVKTCGRATGSVPAAGVTLGVGVVGWVWAGIAAMSFWNDACKSSAVVGGGVEEAGVGVCAVAASVVVVAVAL